jgi:hypothetical protein
MIRPIFLLACGLALLVTLAHAAGNALAMYLDVIGGMWP